MSFFSNAAVIDSASLDIEDTIAYPEYFWDDYTPVISRDNVVAIGDSRNPEPPAPVAPVPQAA